MTSDHTSPSGEAISRRGLSGLTPQMLTLARGTTIELEGDRDDHSIELFMHPVWRYRDPRRGFIDATVWMWLHHGRPVAFEKIEALDGDGGAALWQYCFSSVYEGYLRAQWGSKWTYQSTRPGVIFETVPGAPLVAATSSERRQQLRELVGQFSASIQHDERGPVLDSLRLITTSFSEFEEQNTKLLQGAVFAYSANSANPDLLLIFEAGTQDDKPVWKYSPARMTTGGITVKHQANIVWQCEFEKPGKTRFGTWTYFQSPRE